MKAILISLTVAVGLGGVPAVAQDANAAIKARQGQFRIMSFNLGILGAMVKGDMEYDAAVAQSAADNLVMISQIDQGQNWPDNSSEMDAANTRAKPEIWENLDDVLAKWQDFGTAAKSMQEVAGEGTDAIRTAMGTVGGSCKACHEKYRSEQ